MDTSTKTIATLVPEKIAGFEMEFAKDEKTGLYADDFRATLTVKVGNDARKLKFNKSSKYHSSEYATNEKGERVCLKESYDEELVGIDPYTRPFEDLNKLGIEVDVTALVDEYTSKLVIAMVEQDQLKRARFVKSYENSWIHKGLVEILTSKKYKGECSAEKSEMGEYPNSRYQHITLTYKDQVGTIAREAVHTGGRHSSGSEWRFKIDGAIVPGYRGKYYRTLEMCMVKFMAMVDEAIAIQKATLTREEKEKTEREAKAKNYSSIFKMPVVIKSSEKGDRRSGYYKTYSYYLKSMAVEDNEQSMEFLISEEWKRNETDPQTFTLGGFRGLSPEKIKAIIGIVTSK